LGTIEYPAHARELMCEGDRLVGELDRAFLSAERRNHYLAGDHFAQFATVGDCVASRGIGGRDIEGVSEGTDVRLFEGLYVFKVHSPLVGQAEAAAFAKVSFRAVCNEKLFVAVRW